MAPAEVYVSNELIAVIGTAITLAAVILASMRGIRADMRALRVELKEGDSSLREELKAFDSSLREELKAGDSSLREEMRAGFKETNARLVNLGDRLSKVEGIMEGMFWSGRNQAPDKPREGVA